MILFIHLRLVKEASIPQCGRNGAIYTIHIHTFASLSWSVMLIQMHLFLLRCTNMCVILHFVHICHSHRIFFESLFIFYSFLSIPIQIAHGYSFSFSSIWAAIAAGLEKMLVFGASFGLVACYDDQCNGRNSIPSSRRACYVCVCVIQFRGNGKFTYKQRIALLLCEERTMKSRVLNISILFCAHQQ